MKVYFTCSIRGALKYKENYLKIHRLIESMSHVHVGDDGLCTREHQIYEDPNYDLVEHNRQTMEKIHRAEVIVIEVSVHSISMGYVIHAALSLGKPVIALHIKNMRPVFLDGIKTDKLQVLEYGLDNLSEVLRYALEVAEQTTESRFTMLIDKEVREALDKVAATGQSRSQYIRDLILKAEKITK